MKAIIYKPAQNAMQTGTGFKDKWLLEFEKQSATSIDDVMGWNSTSDINKYLSLNFSSRYDAEDYAKRNDIEYKIIEPKTRKVKIKSYASNFK